MHVTTADKRATFKTMHESGCFILPNPVDVGSAKALQHLGFKALAQHHPEMRRRPDRLLHAA